MTALRNWRKTQGLTQVGLAEQIGTSQSQIVKFENGSARPSIDVAKRIEAATNGEVTAAELLGLSASDAPETPHPPKHGHITVTFDPAYLKELKKFGLNAEAIARRAVEEKVKAARLKAWVAENQSAFDAHAKDVEENGLWSDGLRQF